MVLFLLSLFLAFEKVFVAIMMQMETRMPARTEPRPMVMMPTKLRTKGLWSQNWVTLPSDSVTSCNL